MMKEGHLKHTLAYNIVVSFVMVSYVPQVREEQMVRICLYVLVCVCDSAHDCGCVVDGSNAIVAL